MWSNKFIYLVEIEKKFFSVIVTSDNIIDLVDSDKLIYLVDRDKLIYLVTVTNLVDCEKVIYWGIICWTATK